MKRRFAGLPREFVSDHLHVDLLTHLKPQVPDEVFIDPRFELTHPDIMSVKSKADTSMRRSVTTSLKYRR